MIWAIIYLITIEIELAREFLVHGTGNAISISQRRLLLEMGFEWIGITDKSYALILYCFNIALDQIRKLYTWLNGRNR